MENSGLLCLREIAAQLHWNVNFSALITEDVKQKYANDPVACIVEITEKLGWKPKTVTGQQDFLQTCSDPVLIQFRSGRFVFAFKPGEMKSTGIELIDPEAANRKVVMPSHDVIAAFSGTAVVFGNLQEVDPKQQTGLFALTQIGRHHNTPMDIRRIMHDYAVGDEEPTPQQLRAIANDQGFKAKFENLKFQDMKTMGAAFPFIGFKNDGKAYIVCGVKPKEDKDTLVVVDVTEPFQQQPFQFWDEEHFQSVSSGKFMLLKKIYKLTDEEQPFRLSWFLPEFLKLKGVFGQIILLVAAMTIISLVTPLFFQVVVDKVLVHRGFTTLNVLGIGIVATLIFNGFLEFMRSYLLLFATNKVDINTATKTFRKLMHLPIDFFERNSSGILLKHMQQTEKIRGFLSGNLFFTVLDLFSLLIFLPFLMLYSLPLTGIVLFFSFLMVLVVALLIKPFQRRLNDLYQAEGKRQSMLVETIHGIRTVKSLALEPVEEKLWDNTTAGAINACFQVGKISITARSISMTLEGLMMIAVIWYGSLLYFNGVMSIGALIAFQMLSGRITAPLVKLVGLIHEYQQVSLSVQMLGVVMNARPEPSGSGIRQPVKGAISFENISFQYSPDRPNIIRDFSLDIKPGQVIGIVGRSGSGKTTLTKLLQGLYPPQRGMIKIDGIDIREIDKAHLRCSIGMVLQENYFFTGTIRENISLTKRHATLEEIIYVSQLAGAHEFVSELPQGYDTKLDENASNLSGGQKQRLAIARALLTNPPILIFDEATSALDPESENIVQTNLRQIAKGRTVLIISHRLSIVSNAEKILVMEHGKLSATGSHRDLMAQPGLYRDFWQQQMSGGMAK